MIQQDGQNGAGIGQAGNGEAEHHQALVQGCKGGVDQNGTKEHAEQSADFEVGRRGIAGVDGQEVESCISDETEQDVQIAVGMYPAKDVGAEDRQECLEHGGADQHRDQRYERTGQCVEDRRAHRLQFLHNLPSSRRSLQVRRVFTFP